MRFDDAERIYWVILMHRNQLKVNIVNFKVIFDKIRKRLSSVSYLYYFKSRECISGHTIFISRPIQDNLISTTNLTRVDKFKTTTNIAPENSTIGHTFHE